MKQVVIPAGFVEQRTPRQVWWIQREWARFFPTDFGPFTKAPQADKATVAMGGRDAIQRILLTNGETAIVRRYRRGGFVRHFIHDVYWDRPLRPFAELSCTEQARRRGAPTIEVLAAGIEWTVLGCYRGVLVSREAAGFVNLWEWLHSAPLLSTRAAVLHAAARAIARMHEAGVYHADLNLTNILVRATTTAVEALLIDFDRARVEKAPLSGRLREHNLQRLRRSIDKLDPGGLLITPRDVAALSRRSDS
jgi:3-deoxy-D-manno-octulosonic acid kinase